MIKKEKRDCGHTKLDMALNKTLLNKKKWRSNE